jgi:hypothetical protein
MSTSGAYPPVPSVDRISAYAPKPARKEKRNTKAVCVRLSPAEYLVVERIATHRAMTIPDVLRAGIDHLTIKDPS